MQQTETESDGYDNIVVLVKGHSNYYNKNWLRYLILYHITLTKFIQFSVRSRYTNLRMLLNSPGRMNDMRLFLNDKTSKYSTSSNTPKNNRKTTS